MQSTRETCKENVYINFTYLFKFNETLHFWLVSLRVQLRSNMTEVTVRTKLKVYDLFI